MANRINSRFPRVRIDPALRYTGPFKTFRQPLSGCGHSKCVCLWRIPHPPCFADDTAHVADVPGGLHVVALDVPDHGGAPRRLLAAEVAGVHAVLVGHEAVDEGVEVGRGVAGRGDRRPVCKSRNFEG